MLLHSHFALSLLLLPSSSFSFSIHSQPLRSFGMGESSRRSRRRRSRSQERTSNPSRSSRNGPDSPPSYSVEENSDGEWVNSRLHVKWPQPVSNYSESQRSYLSYDDSSSDGKRSERRSKKKRSKREKKESEKGTRSKKSSARSPVSTEKESQYITLSGSETDDSSSKRIRRERKRNVVQTSPQVSRRSRNGLTTDDDDKKIDSIVFDTRSAMMRYKESEDILPAMRRTRSKKKKPSAADQRENEEYNRYYVGVKSRRGVEKELNKPGEFALYYEKPREGEMPAAVSLKIAYRSSTAQAYHFPIQAFEGTDGHNHYVVMQNKSDGKMFTSILSLVKHYSLYSHVDTSTGRLETFSIPHDGGNCGPAPLIHPSSHSTHYFVCDPLLDALCCVPRKKALIE